MQHYTEATQVYTRTVACMYAYMHAHGMENVELIVQIIPLQLVVSKALPVGYRSAMRYDITIRYDTMLQYKVRTSRCWEPTHYAYLHSGETGHLV